MPTITSVVCPYCGCVCDDLEITIENGKIVKNKNGCVLSKAKFFNFNNEHRVQKTLVRKDGKLVEASMHEGLLRAAEILAKANYPVLYGWSSTSVEAQRVGVELAEEVGGVFDNTSTVCHGSATLGMQENGFPSGTLGQVRHRADLIIYWGCDPVSSHPRHMQRYTSFAEGRFERSRLRSTTSERYRQAKKARKLIVVDVRETSTATLADVFLQIAPNRDFEIIQALRVLVGDGELDVEEVAGIPVDRLREVANLLVDCEYGVVFFGMGLSQSMGKSRNIEVLIQLVRDLNAYTKFSMMPMRGHFNVAGSNIVLTWQTGFPFGVDFSLGFPRYNPGETTVVDILNRGEADAFLAIASDPVAGFPKEVVRQLAKVPLIIIDPHLNASSLIADVVLPSAIVGIEVEGTAYRMDRVPLPLKKVIQAPEGVMSDEEILNSILQEVRILKFRQKPA